MGILQEFYEGLLDLIFPTKCVTCGGIALDYICEECMKYVVPVPQPICQRCGHTLHGQNCANCSELPKSFTRGRAAGEYVGVLREAIHQFKYNGLRPLGRPLGDLMYRCLINDASIPWKHCDFIVPVPIHAIRYRLRGYNQSELLAKRVSELTGLPLETSAIVRTVYTRPQVELTREERRENIRGAFAIVDNHVINGANVLLIDDVATTCSTVHEASLSLLQAGAARVYFLCVAFGA